MKKIILTCEHGGAQIPAPYKKLFVKNAAVLKTHRALDIGALAIARDLKKILKAPLEFSRISRLIVDLNRFLHSPTLFSEFTQPLTDSQKSSILNKYYLPHWNKVGKRLHKHSKNKIFHIAVHSMTNQLHGKVRPMQIALLYDSQRKSEKEFARIWIQQLRIEFPHMKLARNNPYKGGSEGLTTFFRTQYSEKNYLGIEIELNQKFLKSLKTSSQRKKFSYQLAASLDRAIDLFI